MTGKIVRMVFDKGFAFASIDGNSKQDVFVHQSECRQGIGFAGLTIGSRIAFDVIQSPKGLRATNVAVI